MNNYNITKLMIKTRMDPSKTCFLIHLGSSVTTLNQTLMIYVIANPSMTNKDTTPKRKRKNNKVPKRKKVIST